MAKAKEHLPATNAVVPEADTGAIPKHILDAVSAALASPNKIAPDKVTALIEAASAPAFAPSTTIHEHNRAVHVDPRGVVVVSAGDKGAPYPGIVVKPKSYEDMAAASELGKHRNIAPGVNDSEHDLRLSNTFGAR